MTKDFTAAGDFMGKMDRTARASARAMIGAIDHAIANGSLVVADMAVDGKGVPLAFLSKEDMLAERRRLSEMLA